MDQVPMLHNSLSVNKCIYEFVNQAIIIKTVFINWSKTYLADILEYNFLYHNR